VRIDVPTLFLKWYKKRVRFIFREIMLFIGKPIHFSYLLRLGNFGKSPRTLRKFPKKCQKIAGCWGRAVYVRNLRSPRHLAHPLRNDPVQTILQFNHGLTQRAPITPLVLGPCNTASSTLSCLFQQKERDKAEVSTSRGGKGARCVRPWLTRDVV